MPFHFDVDPNRKCVIATAYGAFDDADMREMIQRYATHPDIVPGSVSLVDLRGVADYRITAECIREMADFTVGRPTRFRKRAIVAADDLQFGMSRMYQMLRDGTPAEQRLFRDVDEARRWLEIE